MKKMKVPGHTIIGIKIPGKPLQKIKITEPGYLQFKSLSELKSIKKSDHVKKADSSKKTVNPVIFWVFVGTALYIMYHFFIGITKI